MLVLLIMPKLNRPRKNNKAKSAKNIAFVKNRTQLYFDLIKAAFEDETRANEAITTVADVCVEAGGISHDTFFKHFPEGSEMYNQIKMWIWQRRAKLKRIMRHRMMMSDSAAAQIAVYKLMGDQEELEALGERRMNNVNANVSVNHSLDLDFTKLDIEEKKTLLALLDKAKGTRAIEVQKSQETPKLAQEVMEAEVVEETENN